jgi:hypothetical protein
MALQYLERVRLRGLMLFVVSGLIVRLAMEIGGKESVVRGILPDGVKGAVPVLNHWSAERGD